MDDTNSGNLADEDELIEALLNGDDDAFEWLIDAYHTALVRTALVYTGDARVAEEAVQETWMAALRGLKQFERRSSIKTWLFSILVNRARTMGMREGRYQSVDMQADPDKEQATVAPNRFNPDNHPTRPGHWATFPPTWPQLPEAIVEVKDLLVVIQSAIAELPIQQREVITLRDVEHFASQEVCAIMEISEANQRVLLHRARSKVRRAIEGYFEEAG